jgi:hypothetical protein
VLGWLTYPTRRPLLKIPFQAGIRILSKSGTDGEQRGGMQAEKASCRRMWLDFGLGHSILTTGSKGLYSTRASIASL